MNNELERIWKEAVVAEVKVLYRNVMEGLGKTTNNQGSAFFFCQRFEQPGTC